MIAVVIPCYRVRGHILGVLQRLAGDIDRIYIVDDACPEQTGRFVEEQCRDPRIQVLYARENMGVGVATIIGINAALNESANIIVKLDGDGQMDPEMISELIKPLRNAEADYVKGNRFYHHDMLKAMPKMRLLGNSILSFISKFSTGYWSSMDPTNGFFAIYAGIAREIEWDKVSKRYFFESDLLFHLSLSKAVIKNFPMHAHYGEEMSNLSIAQAAITFPFMHLKRFIKRTYYNYFLRDFNACSLMLVIATLFLPFGIIFGSLKWYQSIVTAKLTSTGTVMIAVLPIVLGFQAFLTFLQLDIENEPRVTRKKS
jgi:glycosyltransferase involved in cell wall biosynthesis